MKSRCEFTYRNLIERKIGFVQNISEIKKSSVKEIIYVRFNDHKLYKELSEQDDSLGFDSHDIHRMSTIPEDQKD